MNIHIWSNQGDARIQNMYVKLDRMNITLIIHNNNEVY